MDYCVWKGLFSAINGAIHKYTTFFPDFQIQPWKHKLWQNKVFSLSAKMD